MPDEIMRKLIHRMNLHDLVITYGQTETVRRLSRTPLSPTPLILPASFSFPFPQSPATIMSSTTSPVSLRCTTVGLVLPHTQIRIIDTSHPLYPARGTPSVPVGVPGEIWSAGYAVMKGYWENEEETDKVVFEDEHGVRWMKTGDEGIMDAEGYVSIVGRIKGELFSFFLSFFRISFPTC